MPRHPYAVLVALASAMLFPSVGAASTPTTTAPPPSGVERLWSEYPIQRPAPEAPSDERPSRPEPTPTDPRQDARPASADKGGSTVDLMIFIGLGAAAGAIVVLFLAAKLLRMVREDDEVDFDRPRLFGRRRSPMTPSIATAAGARKDDRPVSEERRARLAERVAAHAPSAAPAPVSTEPIPSKRSVPVKQFRQSNEQKESAREERARTAEREGTAGDTSNDYGRLGEQVTAVLTTAERAAAEIRESASVDARELRRDAEKRVAEAEAEVEMLRAEADVYRDETRGAADSYAAETRRAADADAAKTHAAAEEDARAVRAEAERKATEIEAEAVRRRDALRESAIHLEERIAGMLSTFRAMTTDLEGLLPGDAQRAGRERQHTDEEVVVDDALEDALKPERAA